MAHGEAHHHHLEAEAQHGAHLHHHEEHYRCLQCHMERPASDFLVGDGASGAWHQYCRGCMLYEERAMQEQQMQHLLAAQVVDVADHAHVLAHHAHAHHGAHAHPLVGPAPGAHALAAPPAVHLLPSGVAVHLLAQEALPGGVHGPGPGFAPAMIYPEARQGLGAFVQPLPLPRTAPVAAAPAAAAAAPGRRPASKVCTKCRQQRPLSEFPELKGKKKGRSPHCSTCKAGAAEVVREQEVGQKRALEEVEEDASAAGSLEATAHGAPRAHATRSEAAAAAAGFEQRQQAEGEGADEGPVEEGWQEAHPMEVTEKPCMHCGEMLPAAAFRGSKNKTDRLQNRCKVCEIALGRGTKRDKTATPVVKVAHKLCRRCGAHKDASLFFQSKLSLDGLCTYCKACQKDLNQLARAKRPELPREEVGMKECRHCHQARPADMYFKSKMNLDGLYSYCKPCATVLNSASKKKRRAEVREQKRQQAGAAAAGPGLAAPAAAGLAAPAAAMTAAQAIRRPVFKVPPDEQAVFSAAAAAATAAARAPSSVLAAAAAAAAAAAMQVGQRQQRLQQAAAAAAAASLQAAQKPQQAAPAQQQRREAEGQQAQQQQQQQAQQAQQAQYEAAEQYQAAEQYEAPEGYGGEAVGPPPPFSAVEQAQYEAAQAQYAEEQRYVEEQQQYTEEQMAQYEYEAAHAQYGGGGHYEVVGQQYPVYATAAEQYIHAAQQYGAARHQGAYGDGGGGGEGFDQQQYEQQYGLVTSGDASHHHHDHAGHAQYHHRHPGGEVQYAVDPAAAGPLTHEQLSAVLGHDLMAAVALTHQGAGAGVHGGHGPPYDPHSVLPMAGYPPPEGHVAAAMQHYYQQQQQQQVYAEEQHPGGGAPPCDYQLMNGEQQPPPPPQQQQAAGPPPR